MGTPPLIVFTDLDGTLLDHESYSCEAARPALDKLAHLGVPLILASSKTAAEIVEIQRQVGCSGFPAIVENGAGLHDPFAPGPSDENDEYARLLDALDSVGGDLRFLFEGFHDLGPEGIVRTTGLAPKSAGLAGQRRHSEPGLWHGTDAELRSFLVRLEDKGVTGRRGGRFLTLSFGGTKADRVDEIAARFGNPPRIALGDAPNDVELLEAADHGVIIANPHGPSVPELPGEAAGLIRRTSLAGPRGWNSAVLDLLYQLNL